MLLNVLRGLHGADLLVLLLPLARSAEAEALVVQVPPVLRGRVLDVGLILHLLEQVLLRLLPPPRLLPVLLGDVVVEAELSGGVLVAKAVAAELGEELAVGLKEIKNGLSSSFLKDINIRTSSTLWNLSLSAVLGESGWYFLASARYCSRTLSWVEANVLIRTGITICSKGYMYEPDCYLAAGLARQSASRTTCCRPPRPCPCSGNALWSGSSVSPGIAGSICVQKVIYRYVRSTMRIGLYLVRITCAISVPSHIELARCNDFCHRPTDCSHC